MGTPQGRSETDQRLPEFSLPKPWEVSDASDLCDRPKIDGFIQLGFALPAKGSVAKPISREYLAFRPVEVANLWRGFGYTKNRTS